MIKLLTFSFLLLLNFAAVAQNNSSVSGKIIEGKNISSSAASVSLIQSSDSSVIRSLVTDKIGEFKFLNLAPGKYFIAATSVGFKKAFSNNFELKESQSYNLAPLTLLPGNTQLAGVDVQTKKSPIEVTADKTIFNIEGTINAAGGNAFELLQKAPGVTTDKDDNISLKGKNGVRIYIDGKISPIGGKDLADFLRSINSADMESIEMISNPSAKYDASGNAGIINIRLKKNKNFGTNGSISAGLAIAHTLKENSSFSINHRNKKLNIFSSYSNNFGHRRQFFNLYRIQNDTIFNQHSINTTDPHTHNFKAGMDYFIDKKNTIGFVVNGNFNTNNYDNVGSTLIMYKTAINPLKILYASDLQPYKRSNLNYNLNYRYANGKGSELTMDGDLGRFRSNANSYQPNKYKDAITDTLIYEKNYQNYTPTDIDITTLKVDFETPWAKGKFGIGGKYSNVETRNVFDFYTVYSGVNYKDSGRSNKFNYSEIVNALYLTYTKPLGKKWNVRAGVRMENTVSEGNLISFYPQPENNVKRNYTNLFPSGALSFTADKKNSFSLSYSRRIDRPNYEDLNPFENKIDELTYQKGNAFLRPQYTNITELTHTFMSRFNTTISYSHIKDFRAAIIDTTDKNCTFRTIKNLASQDLFNVNFNAPFTIKKWWNVFFTFNGYHSLYKADFGAGKIINLGAAAYNLYLQQSFIIQKGLTFELTGSYNSPFVYGGTFKNDAMGNLDAGLQKVVFKGKGNIKLAYTDILKTQKFRGISDFGGVYIDVNGRGESNQLRINFTYRFGR